MSGIEEQKAQENSLVLSAKEKIAKIKAMREGTKEKDINETSTSTETNTSSTEADREEVLPRDSTPRFKHVDPEPQIENLTQQQQIPVLQKIAFERLAKIEEKNKNLYENNGANYLKKVQDAKDVRSAPYLQGLSELETTLSETEALLYDLEAELSPKLRESQRLIYAGEDYTAINAEIEKLDMPIRELREEQSKLREEIAKRKEKLATLDTEASANKAIWNVREYMSDKYNNVFNKVGAKVGLTGQELGNDLYEKSLENVTTQLREIKKAIDKETASVASGLHETYVAYQAKLENMLHNPEIVQAKKTLNSKGFLGFLGKPNEEAIKNAKHVLATAYNEITKLTGETIATQKDHIAKIANNKISIDFKLRQLPHPDTKIPFKWNNDPSLSAERKKMYAEYEQLINELETFNKGDTGSNNDMQTTLIRKWKEQDLKVNDTTTDWVAIMGNKGTEKTKELLQGSGEDGNSIQKYLQIQGVM